jgi:hypothetical protein
MILCVVKCVAPLRKTLAMQRSHTYTTQTQMSPKRMMMSTMMMLMVKRSCCLTHYQHLDPQCLRSHQRCQPHCQQPRLCNVQLMSVNTVHVHDMSMHSNTRPSVQCADTCTATHPTTSGLHAHAQSNSLPPPTKRSTEIVSSSASIWGDCRRRHHSTCPTRPSITHDATATSDTCNVHVAM